MVYHTIGKCSTALRRWHPTDPLLHFVMRQWRILVAMVLIQVCTTVHWSTSSFPASVQVTWGTQGHHTVLWVVWVVMWVGLWLVVLLTFTSDDGTADVMPHVWFNIWVPGQVYIWPIVTSCFPVMSLWEKNKVFGVVFIFHHIWSCSFERAWWQGDEVNCVPDLSSRKVVVKQAFEQTCFTEVIEMVYDDSTFILLHWIVQYFDKVQAAYFVPFRVKDRFNMIMVLLS